MNIETMHRFHRLSAFLAFGCLSFAATANADDDTAVTQPSAPSSENTATVADADVDDFVRAQLSIDITIQHSGGTIENRTSCISGSTDGMSLQVSTSTGDHDAHYECRLLADSNTWCLMELGASEQWLCGPLDAPLAFPFSTLSAEARVTDAVQF